ncbi:S-layer homology domain-containing protein [Candidatus Peribacteria bacterium]|nr:S-layer homology domain-containing protein [Candidatus Peribacteria bacterium]
MDISSRKCACSASLILVLLLWSNTASARFFDVQADHPYADAIDLLTREGVLHGYENRSFQPEREINRAEFTKMLMAIIFPEEYINTCIESLSDDAVIPNLTFPDVPHEAWFAPSICTAWTNGIVDGYPDGLFRPEEGVTFVEAAKMLSLAFGLTGFDLPNFGNANAIWYQPYVEFLATENAIPMSINDLSQYVNRGEVAEMIYRLKGYPLTPSPVPQRLSKSTEEVAYPVTWKSYINDDYTFSFSYPSVWPEPYVDRRGHYDGRLPYYKSSWAVYFGPKSTKQCLGSGDCIERDMWIEGYDLEDSAEILDIIESDKLFVDIEDQTIINGLPMLNILEEVGDCIDKRSFHFGSRWIYSMNIRCAGQDDTLYGIFEQMVTTLEQTDERPPEHRN